MAPKFGGNQLIGGLDWFGIPELQAFLTAVISPGHGYICKYEHLIINIHIYIIIINYTYMYTQYTHVLGINTTNSIHQSTSTTRKGLVLLHATRLDRRLDKLDRPCSFCRPASIGI